MGRRLKLVGRGAAIGARTWSVFGLVAAALGLVLSALAPTWARREPALAPLTLLTALAYPLIGMMVGAAAAVGAGESVTLARPRAHGDGDGNGDGGERANALVEAIVTVSILVVISLTLRIGDAGRRVAWSCPALYAGLAIAVIARAVRPRHRVAALGSIWLISLVSAGVPQLVSSAVARGAGREALGVAAIWMDGLRARNLLDETLIVVTSDHGEAFDEHGIVGHGVSVYEHQVHVPLIVKWPRLSAAAPGASALNVEPVSSVDLLPTMLDIAGEAVPSGVQGRSLIASESGAEPAARLVFAEGFGSNSFSPESFSPESFSSNRPVERAAFESDGRKLIVDPSGRARLFDISSDRREPHDLLARQPADAARLQNALARQFVAGPFRPVTTGTPAPDVLERLRSLGYVQ